ncbi:uncharacterized protein PFL1_03047 [Pseudozyma flocculosa PF-1]|uniref:Uncharacterized protein n=1 Tax=Pseudozyma flocculosa PF-1 TaxID=1277687 RepID=A0A061H8R0_9BASI|nr:uncharacterized protein PFL1_03047 [Pseudozyma flocculosa PF-1]EPQ29292.1 hypothetical protein PFL1_03047 [Pseudozyma flocculosa PF-1]
MNYLSLLVAALALSVGVDCVSPPPSIDKDFGPAIGRFTVEWSQGKVTICNSYLGFFFVDLNAPRANNYVEVVCGTQCSFKPRFPNCPNLGSPCLLSPVKGCLVGSISEQDYSTKLWPLLNGSQKGIVLEFLNKDSAFYRPLN